MKSGKYTLLISCVGYKSTKYELEVTRNNVGHAHIYLEPEVKKLGEVVVSANRNETDRKEAPVVVSVMTAEQFDKNNAQDLVQT